MNNKDFLKLYHRNYKIQIVFHFLYYLLTSIFIVSFILCIRSQYRNIPYDQDSFYSPLRIVEINEKLPDNINLKGIKSTATAPSIEKIEAVIEEVSGNDRYHYFPIYPYSLLKSFSDEKLENDEALIYTSKALNPKKNFAELSIGGMTINLKFKKLLFSKTNQAFVNDVLYEKIIKISSLTRGSFTNFKYKLSLDVFGFSSNNTVGINREYINNRLDIDISDKTDDMLIEELNNLKLNIINDVNLEVESEVKFYIIPDNVCTTNNYEWSCTYLPNNLIEKTSAISHRSFILFNDISSAQDAIKILAKNNIKYSYEYDLYNEKSLNNTYWIFSSYIIALSINFYCSYLLLNKPNQRKNSYLLSKSINQKNLIVNNIIFALLFFAFAILCSNLAIFAFSKMSVLIGKLSYTIYYEYLFVNFGLFGFLLIDTCWNIKELNGEKNAN